MLAGVAVAVGRWPPFPGPPGPGKGPGEPWRNPPIPFRVPLTKAPMATVRLAFIFVAWAVVILPDETAASIRVVASVTRSLMIFWGSTFFDLASAAMLWPPCSAVFSWAGVRLRSLATMSRDGLAPSIGTAVPVTPGSLNVPVPLTKAPMAAVRLAFIFVAWAVVILPDETA